MIEEKTSYFEKCRCIMNMIKQSSCGLIFFDRHSEYKNWYKRFFWVRGYYCEIVGKVNEASIKKYRAI